MMYRVVLLAFVAYAAANTCPEISPVEDFNFKSFGQGKWYEVARYPNPRERESNCGTAEYTLDGDVSRVRNSYITNNKEFVLNASFKVAPDAGTTGKLLYSLPYGPGKTNIETYLNVLATDYSNYAITYYCKYDEATKTHKDFSWILSRYETPATETKAEIEKFLNSSPFLDGNKYVWPEFSKEVCRIDAELH